MVQSVSKKRQEGRGQQERERESASVSQQIQSIEAKQVLILIVLTRHRSAVYESGYTSDAVSVELRTRVVRILYS